MNDRARKRRLLPRAVVNDQRVKFLETWNLIRELHREKYSRMVDTSNYCKRPNAILRHDGSNLIETKGDRVRCSTNSLIICGGARCNCDGGFAARETKFPDSRIAPLARYKATNTRYYSHVFHLYSAGGNGAAASDVSC